MDDSVNRNFWHVPTNTMKKYASSFIGRPFIYHPSGDHPSYIKEGVVHDSPTLIDDILHLQNRYKAGDIIDVTYEPNKDNPNTMGWYATIKVTNQEIYDKIKSGAISSYVSPQIYDISKAEPGQPTTEFIPLHIASVNEPAYGNIARIRAACSGTGPSCINALKSAALQVISAIDSNSSSSSNSSFQKNLGNNTDRLTNLTSFQPDQQVIANQGYNPNSQGQIVTNNNNQDGQFISEKKQVQEVDVNGNIITRTEDKKPRPVQNKQPNNIIADPQAQAQQQMQQQQQPVPQPTIQQQATGPVIDPNNTPQMPAELLETIKGLQAGLTGITERLNNVENFKKSSEDEKIKAASEAQRQIIESVFTPELIQDENARQDVVNYFAGLPLADDDLKKILDMIVTGTFSSSADNNNNNQNKPQGGAPKKQPTGSGNFKQGSINRLVMNQVQNQSSYQDNYRGSAPISMAKRFFSDIAVENI